MSRKLFWIIAGIMAILCSGPSAQAGDKWAVIVGVNDYGENIPRLRFAVTDAKRIYGLMMKCAGTDHVILLTSGGDGLTPTGANITQSVDHLAARAKPDDEFWFCFSGHGEDQNGAHYLLPSDVRVSDYKNTAINLKDLRHWLTTHCAARQKILVVDACHSGWDDLTEGQRGVTVGVPTLWASCGAQESSWEIPALGEGVFTFFFLKKQEGIAPNGMRIPNEDDAKSINTHVETYIKRNKKPFTQTPQVIGTLPNAGLIPGDLDGQVPTVGLENLPDPPGDAVAREPLGPVLLLDLPETRTQVNGTILKSEITQSLLRDTLVKQNFPIVDPAAASQLKNLLNRQAAAAKAKKLGAAYLIRGHAETEATKLSITRDFVNVQATVTAELIDESGNVLAQAVVGSTQDEPVVGSDITESGAAKMALQDAVQKLTAALLPKLRAVLSKPTSGNRTSH